MVKLLELVSFNVATSTMVFRVDPLTAQSKTKTSYVGVELAAYAA